MTFHTLIKKFNPVSKFKIRPEIPDFYVAYFVPRKPYTVAHFTVIVFRILIFHSFKCHAAQQEILRERVESSRVLISDKLSKLTTSEGCETVRCSLRPSVSYCNKQSALKLLFEFAGDQFYIT